MPCLGVDLVEIRKAKSFYQTHRERLNSFFSPKEVRQIRAAGKPHEKLALILAQKEAVFKARKKRARGFLDFAWVSEKDKKAFRFSFMKTKDYVVARCVGI
jgi:phosphopantetheine--protein transferase-like protein